MNRIKSILVLFIIILVFSLIFIIKIPMPCLIEKATGIDCPSCGITRSFLCIFNLDFYGAFKYNIFGIPLFIFSVISVVILIIDSIFNTDKSFELLNKLFSSKWFIIIMAILIIVSTIKNNLTL